MYKFYCEKCNFGTDTKTRLTRHEETDLHKTGQRKKRESWKKKEEDKKIYKCKDCDYTTSFNKNYLTHKLNNHSSKEERASLYKYYCSLCNVGSFTILEFNKHKETLKHCGMCHITNKYENKDNIINI